LDWLWTEILLTASWVADYVTLDGRWNSDSHDRHQSKKVSLPLGAKVQAPDLSWSTRHLSRILQLNNYKDVRIDLCYGVLQQQLYLSWWHEYTVAKGWFSAA
jgi:hypothetical protein